MQVKIPKLSLHNKLSCFDIFRHIQGKEQEFNLLKKHWKLYCTSRALISKEISYSGTLSLLVSLKQVI